MGRPTKLNARVQKKICAALSAGNTRTAASGAAGVDPDTFFQWMRRGKGTEKDRAQTPLYVAFVEAVEKAEHSAEVDYLDVIKNAAGSGNWQAAAWWLERRKSGDYRRTDRIENTGADGRPQETVVKVIYEDAPCQSTPSESNGHTNGRGISLTPRPNAKL